MSHRGKISSELDLLEKRESEISYSKLSDSELSESEMRNSQGKQVFAKTKGLTERQFHYCPGCTHGIIHRLIREVLEELNLVEKTIGIAPVGCAGFFENYFSCDMVGAAHGRAVAVATGVKRAAFIVTSEYNCRFNRWSSLI